MATGAWSLVTPPMRPRRRMRFSVPTLNCRASTSAGRCATPHACRLLPICRALMWPARWRGMPMWPARSWGKPPAATSAHAALPLAPAAAGSIRSALQLPWARAGSSPSGWPLRSRRAGSNRRRCARPPQPATSTRWACWRRLAAATSTPLRCAPLPSAVTSTPNPSPRKPAAATSTCFNCARPRAGDTRWPSPLPARHTGVFAVPRRWASACATATSSPGVRKPACTGRNCRPASTRSIRAMTPPRSRASFSRTHGPTTGGWCLSASVTARSHPAKPSSCPSDGCTS